MLTKVLWDGFQCQLNFLLQSACRPMPPSAAAALEGHCWTLEGAL